MTFDRYVNLKYKSISEIEKTTVHIFFGLDKIDAGCYNKIIIDSMPLRKFFYGKWKLRTNFVIYIKMKQTGGLGEVRWNRLLL